MINRPDVTGRVRRPWWRFALLGLVLLSLSSASHLSISRTYATTTPGLWAWGSNGYGQLGNGTTASSSSPVQVSGLTGVTAITAGWGHSLVVKSDGGVWAWGYNVFGQ